MSKWVGGSIRLIVLQLKMKQNETLSKIVLPRLFNITELTVVNVFGHCIKVIYQINMFTTYSPQYKCNEILIPKPVHFTTRNWRLSTKN